MKKIRVLVVDDSIVVRRIISDVLAAEPDIEVIGTASNGKRAIEQVEEWDPDFISLDVEMPVMDGLEALPRIRELRPKTPIVMFSTLTDRGAAATLEALSLGATSYLTKPSNVRDLEDGQERIRAELVPKIRALCRPESRSGDIAAPVRRRTARSKGVGLVAIGASTGGPNALTTVLSTLPEDFQPPIVITQHMPPVFTKYLAERLDAKCPLQVREAEGGERLESGHVWIAPGGFHLLVERRDSEMVLRLDDGARVNSCRPAVDPMFQSVATACGARALGVVLTGMGHDGLDGARALQDAGASVFAQDEASSVVWGMPAAVAEAGLADEILALAQVSDAIIAHSRSPESARELV